MRAQACSWPGWLDSTISTSHLSRSMSTSSLSSATSRSMTISRCRGDRMPSLFELQQVSAAAGRNAFELVTRKHAQRGLRGFDVRARAFAGEVRQPVERAFDVVTAESGALEIGSKGFAFGYFRGFRQHVLVEHVNKNV